MLCNELSPRGPALRYIGPRLGVPLQRSFERNITPDKPSTAPLTTSLMDELVAQVSRAFLDGATEPEAFILPLRLPRSYFGSSDWGVGYKKLHTFGVTNGTPFCEFSREFRIVVSAATGTERVLAPGAELAFEVVRMAVNEQYPSLMPSLYPGAIATEPRPFGTWDAMWLAFQTLASNKTPTINCDNCCSLPAFSSGARSSVGAPTRR